jgi:LysR family hydrogen peroxide-inducible transcriptional activator
MELHQLRYFVAVAQTGNFSRAAERCFVSQPSLSQQIQKLEQSLGQSLFHRLGRKTTLSDAGRLLFDRAQVILGTVDDAQRRLKAGDDLQGGRLAIGAIPTVAPYVLPPVLEAFTRRCPQAELIVREDVTAQLIPAVLEGEIDLALVALPVTDVHLETEPLVTEALLLAVARGHRLARRKTVSIHDLVDERFILLNEMHCLGEQILNFCRANECQPTIACRSAQLATLQQLIALGQGISLLPEMARRADATKRLVYRPLKNRPQRTIGVIWHRHRYHSALAEFLLAELRRWGARAGGISELKH